MRHLVGFAALVVLCSFLAAGCAEHSAPADSGDKPAASGTPKTAPGTDMPDPHMAPEGDVAKVDFAALEKAYTDADAAFKKAPKDEKAKKAYIEATVKLATETMEHSDLPPREKYRKSLKLYRDVLKTDPDNEEAKMNSQLIEDIYKSMGRPVPE